MFYHSKILNINQRSFENIFILHINTIIGRHKSKCFFVRSEKISVFGKLIDEVTTAHTIDEGVTKIPIDTIMIGYELEGGNSF